MKAFDATHKRQASLDLGVYLHFDDDGFLTNPQAWTEETAQIIAQIDGSAPLTEQHMAVLHFVRDRYLRLGAIPSMRRICRNSALSRQDLKSLFGSCRQMWRTAGLPNPGEEAKAYMT